MMTSITDQGEDQSFRLDDALHAYAVRILAGTGLSAQDALLDDPAAAGTAAEALRHGWQTAQRAGRVRS